MRAQKPLPIVAAALPGLALLALSLFTGCLFETDTRRAGAEDFPNTLTPLGKAAADNLASHGEWNQFSQIPGTLPTLAGSDSLQLQPLPAPAGTQSQSPTAREASGRGAPDSVRWDYSDTATLGVARRITFQDRPLKIRTDTTTFRYDARFKDADPGNDLVLEAKGLEAAKSGLRLHTYRYQNLDSAGPLDRSTFLLRLRGAEDVFKYNLLTMVAGPDGDIATPGDNRPAYFAFARMSALASGPVDTLEAFEITDADGDGTLWGAGDSGTVDFRQKTPTPAQRPAVLLVTQKMRAVLFKDEKRTYPLSFSERRLERDGKEVTFAVHGRRKDSTFAFDPGDTAVVSVDVVFPPDHRIVERHSRFKVKLPAEPKRYLDAQLLDFHVDTWWRERPILATHLDFTPDAPVASQDLSLTGDLTLEIEFANGDSGTVTGRFEDGRIRAEFLERAVGKALRRFRMEWDSQGEVLRKERLE